MSQIAQFAKSTVAVALAPNVFDSPGLPSRVMSIFSFPPSDGARHMIAKHPLE